MSAGPWVGDAVNRPTLERLGIEGIDAAVVSLGQNMSGSILLTLHLTELKVKRVLVKALDDDHGLVLSKLGADQIIFPEREMAGRLARVLTYPNLVDILPLGPDMALVEMAVPDFLAGKSLRELDMRKNITASRSWPSRTRTSVHVDPILDPGQIVEAGTILICMGPDRRPGEVPEPGLRLAFRFYLLAVYAKKFAEDYRRYGYLRCGDRLRGSGYAGPALPSWASRSSAWTTTRPR